MKVFISYPPLENAKGCPCLGQNRQFQWFHNPSYIYPMVPASAATLLQAAGYEVVWDDNIAEKSSYSAFIRRLEVEQPDIIAVETKTPVVKMHWTVVKELKDKFPDMKVVLMGDHITALPEETMVNSPVDYVLTGGDYDFLLLNVANHITRGEGLEPGIWYRSNGCIKNTGPYRLDHDLTSLPVIDRELTKWYLYGEHLFKRKPATYTMVGRDCWYAKCHFCSWTTLFPQFRVRRPEQLLDEVGMLIERYRVKEIFDDTGTFPVGDWLRSFCRGMIERGYNEELNISCNMRVGACTKNDYRLMKKSGFRVLKLGLESANQSTLDRLNKGIRVEQTIEHCRMATRAGLQVHLTIMVGYPWETLQDALNTLELAKKLMRDGYADMLQATVTIPYPGSPLFEEAKANNWLRFMDWERYDMTEPVLTSPIPPGTIMALVQELYTSFITPSFIVRKLLSIRDLDDVRFFLRAGKALWGHLQDFRRTSIGG